MIRLVDMGRKFMLMGIYMKVIGKMIKLRVKESIEKRMGLFIKENGRIICLMEME
jgi:hypothetical protein